MTEPTIVVYDPALFLNPSTFNTRCVICNYVPHTPLLIPCKSSHVVCQSCWRSYNPITHKPSASIRCPSDLCSSIDPQKVTFHKTLQFAIFDSAVRCIHHDRGCMWTGTLGTNDKLLIDHLHECLLVYQACHYCNQKFYRGEYVAHVSSECPERPYTCSICGTQMVYSAKGDHEDPENEMLCQFVQYCPNSCARGTHRTIIRKSELLEHCEVCPLQIVSCTINPSCPSMFRDELTDHLNDANILSQHFSSLNKQMQDLTYALQESECKRQESEARYTHLLQESEMRYTQFVQSFLSSLPPTMLDQIQSHVNTTQKRPQLDAKRSKGTSPVSAASSRSFSTSSNSSSVTERELIFTNPTPNAFVETSQSATIMLRVNDKMKPLHISSLSQTVSQLRQCVSDKLGIPTERFSLSVESTSSSAHNVGVISSGEGGGVLSHGYDMSTLWEMGVGQHSILLVSIRNETIMESKTSPEKQSSLPNANDIAQISPSVGSKQKSWRWPWERN